MTGGSQGISGDVALLTPVSPSPQALPEILLPEPLEFLPFMAWSKTLGPHDWYLEAAQGV